MCEIGALKSYKCVKSHSTTSSTTSKSYSRVVTLLINSCKDDKNIWKWWKG